MSVVMITRDRRAEALHAIERLLELPESPRVIVVDNASRDGTADAISQRHPGVQVVELPRNLGAAGRNVGVQVATTPYVAFSDDDSWWEAGALWLAADRFDADPSLALMAGRMLVGPHRVLDTTCVAMASSGLPAAADGGIPIVGFIACGAVVRRNAFLEAGGFDPRFGVGGEEQVLSLDLLHAGWSMRYFDEIVAFHHPSLARDPAARRRRERRNALWSAWLRRHSREAWRATLEALRDGRESRAALLEALREFRWILRNRRPVRPEVERLVKAIAVGSQSASLTRDLA